ncbi:MAG: hypothetical protein ACWA41_01185 [Putridiphycobacter sp.]
MKKLGFIIVLAAIMLSCMKDKIISYTYKAGTRGYQVEISVSKDSTHIIQSGRVSKTMSYETSSDFWKQLKSDTKSVELKEIGQLKSPTNKRQLDAAAHASLTIATKDSIYQSSSFDGGQPPAMIKAIVDALVTEAEKINEK